MDQIDDQRLDAVLGALGEQLGAAGASVHLVVIGGTALLAAGFVGRVTNDVDVVAVREGAALRSSEPLPPRLRDAATRVARDFGLVPNWLNAGPTSLLVHGLPDGFLERCRVVRFGPHLSVSFAHRLDLIHLKFYAATDRDEARDWDDLRALAPTADELRAAARWVRTHNAPGPFDDAVADALGRLGVRDEGRCD